MEFPFVFILNSFIPEFSSKGFEKPHNADYEGQSRYTSRFDGLAKALITNRLSIQYFLMLNFGLTNKASISKVFPGYFSSKADQAASSIPNADNGPSSLY